MRLSLHKKRSQAGKVGGLATLERHGLDHFKQIGSTGGRPKRLTLQELRAKDALIHNSKEERLEHRNSSICNLIIDLVQEASANNGGLDDYLVRS